MIYVLAGLRSMAGWFGLADDDPDRAVLQRLPRTVQRRIGTKRREMLETLLGDKDLLAGGSIAVRHIMSQKLTTVSPETSAEEVTGLMQDGGLRHVLVTTGQRHLVGVISDRDINTRTGSSARDLMTCDPMTIDPNGCVHEALGLLMEKGISCIPVVQHGVLQGMVTTTDMLLTLDCMLTVAMAAGR